MQIRLIRSQFLDASYSIHILSDKLSGKLLLQMDYKTVTHVSFIGPGQQVMIRPYSLIPNQITLN